MKKKQKKRIAASQEPVRQNEGAWESPENINHPQLPESWTEADFEAMSWHDDKLHGFRIHNPELEEDADFDLILELDYCLSWIAKRVWVPELEKEIVIYQVADAPAQLTFHHVDDLHVEFELSYKQDLEIQHIERMAITDDERKKRCYRWTIVLQSTIGEPGRMTFDAHGFTQKLTGPLVGRYNLDADTES